MSVMKRLGQDQGGFTLIELLVASSLMLIVLSATLTSFETFINTNRRDNLQNDQQDAARRGVDQIVRQLRNLANPTSTTSTIAAADDNRIVFQTTDPSKQWVGYCLQTSGSGTSVSNGILWYEIYTNNANPNGVPPSLLTTCPDNGNGWGAVHLADNITNASASARPLGAQPIFRYLTFNSSTAASTPVAAPSTVVRVIANLYVDVEPTKQPGEAVLGSGAYLRNQNQRPTASFKALHASGNIYTLDAGSSSDPEGRTLTYDWYEGAVPGGTFSSLDTSLLQDCSAAVPAAPSSPWNFTCVGTGPTFTKDFGQSTTAFTPSGGPKRVNVWLRVTDPGSLADVTEPPTGNQCLLNTDATRALTECDGLPLS